MKEPTPAATSLKARVGCHMSGLVAMATYSSAVPRGAKPRPTRRTRGSKWGLAATVTSWPRARRARPRPTKGWTSPWLPTAINSAFKLALGLRVIPPRYAKRSIREPRATGISGLAQDHGIIGGMRQRPFGRLRVRVSEIGLGCWQLGGADWGEVPDEQALETLAAAADAGVTFFDTADV